MATGAIVYASVPHAFSNGETLMAEDLNGNFNSLDQRLSALEALLPAGTIVAFGGPAAAPPASPPAVPAGWLICDGSAVSRTTYANLFAAIGINYGGGDGINTFNLPDLRGRFLRGWDNGAGHDPDAANRTASAAGGPVGDAVGTVETDAFKSHNHGGVTGNTDVPHTHTLPSQQGNATGGTGFSGQMFSANSGIPAGTQATSGPSVSLMHMHTIAGQGGSETRPVNVSVAYIIKI